MATKLNPTYFSLFKIKGLVHDLNTGLLFLTLIELYVKMIPTNSLSGIFLAYFRARQIEPKHKYNYDYLVLFIAIVFIIMLLK